MSVRYHVDPVHSKIRLTSLLAFGVSGILGYLAIIPPILSLVPALQEWVFCVRIIGAAGLGVLASWGIERILTPIWPSGRFIEVDDNELTLHWAESEKDLIKWNAPLEITAWHFKIQQGGTTAPRGWHCVACLLAQEDRWVAVYSFINPRELSSIAGWKAFTELPPSRRPSPLRRAPMQKLPSDDLRIAERYRWNEGCELTSDDFNALMAAVEERTPDWP